VWVCACMHVHVYMFGNSDNIVSYLNNWSVGTQVVTNNFFAWQVKDRRP